MKELEYTYWKGKGKWYLGYLNIWPEHMTQGKDIKELEEMLLDLYEIYTKEQEEAKVHKQIGLLKVVA
jgi:predicted RNase H-like HicB family nuclease